MAWLPSLDCGMLTTLELVLPRCIAESMYL
jgi:hypothetical protein